MDSIETEVINDVLDTLESSVRALQVSELEKKALVSKIESLEKAATVSIFSRPEVDTLVAKLSLVGVIPEGYSSKVATHLCSHPKSALSLISQVADALLEPSPEGAGISKASTDANRHGIQTDPDGWDDFVAGRPVKIRRQ